MARPYVHGWPGLMARHYVQVQRVLEDKAGGRYSLQAGGRHPLQSLQAVLQGALQPGPASPGLGCTGHCTLLHCTGLGCTGLQSRLLQSPEIVGGVLPVSSVQAGHPLPGLPAPSGGSLLPAASGHTLPAAEGVSLPQQVCQGVWGQGGQGALGLGGGVSLGGNKDIKLTQKKCCNLLNVVSKAIKLSIIKRFGNI